MKHLPRLTGFTSLLIFLIVSGCAREKSPTIEELREREIERRLNQFITNHREECFQNTLDLAISKADSLLKLNAVKYTEDDLQRPPLPSKPPRILKPAPKDSVRRSEERRVGTERITTSTRPN